MRNIIIVLCLICLLIPSEMAVAQYFVKGTITGFDGKPMLRSDIFLLSNETLYPRPVLKRFTVNADGTFLINFTCAGLYRLNFIGVNHVPFELPLYLGESDTIVVKVQLRGIRYKEKIEEITFYTDYDANTKRYARELKVTINDEGHFIAQFKPNSDLFAYQVDGIDRRGHYVNGMQADFFTPDHMGDYFSVIKAKKDSLITIVLDPDEMPRSESEASYQIIRAPTETVKFNRIYSDYEKRYDDYKAYVAEGRKKGIYDNDYANNYGWKKDFKELDDLIKKENDPFMRKGWLLLRLQIALDDAWAKPTANISKKLALQALEEIPPDSPLWSYHPQTLPSAISYASAPEKTYEDLKKQHIYLSDFGKPFLKYIGHTISSHADSSIRNITLGTAVKLAHTMGDYELFDKYYNQYLKEFEGTHYAERMESHYSPKRKIIPGTQVPDFSLESLDDPKQLVTKQDLLGKNYIIDFWALWCAPCRPVLEALSRIYGQHGGEDFAIISVSLNYSKKDVVEFRRDKLPMPWFHTHLEDFQPKQGVLKDFEIVTIPRVILVDKEGYIVAVNNVDREKFWDTVSAYLARN